MANGLQNTWSTTANNNSTADDTIGWAEGQAPSTVNNSARAMMAAVAEFRKDIAGMLVTGGTSTAYTLTTNEGLTLADGVVVVCRMSATNGAAPTLNVDSTGAVAIQSVQGTAVLAGELRSGGIYAFTYYAASAAWIVRQAPGTLGVLNAPANTKMLFFNTSAPTGWTKDTSLDEVAIRLVGGSVSEDLTPQKFSAAFANRTILQANLPSVNLSSAGLSGLTSHSNMLRLIGGTTAVSTTGATLQVYAAAAQELVQPAVTISGNIPLGGSGTAMDFRVRYTDAIRANKD